MLDNFETIALVVTRKGNERDTTDEKTIVESTWPVVQNTQM